MAKQRISEVLRGILREQGISSTLEKTKRGHEKIRFEAHGKPVMYVCGTTVSDRRAQLNAMADVRRILRGT